MTNKTLLILVVLLTSLVGLGVYFGKFMHKIEEPMQGVRRTQTEKFTRTQSIVLDRINIDEQDSWVQLFGEEFVIKLQLAEQFVKKGAMKPVSHKDGKFDVDAIMAETEKTIDHYNISHVPIRRKKKDRSVVNENFSVALKKSDTKIVNINE